MTTPTKWLSPRAALIANIGGAYAARCIDCGYFGREFAGLDDFDGMRESIEDVDAHARAEHVDAEGGDRGTR